MSQFLSGFVDRSGLFYVLNDATEWVAVEKIAVADVAMELLQHCVASWEHCYSRFYESLPQRLAQVYTAVVEASTS